MAGLLDIAVGFVLPVLRLAECPSGRGERSLPLPAKSLASVARQSDHALSLSTLELSVSRGDQDLLC